jgi:hypothetical protein
MSKSLGTTWNLDPHTAKKHEFLRRGRVVHIDGFAGPGSYSAGDDGSPVVVLKAARDHAYPRQVVADCDRVWNTRWKLRNLSGRVRQESGKGPEFQHSFYCQVSAALALFGTHLSSPQRRKWMSGFYRRHQFSLFLNGNW